MAGKKMAKKTVHTLLALQFLKGCKKGIAHNTSIPVASMHTNFISKRRPSRSALPGKGAPDGL